MEFCEKCGALIVMKDKKASCANCNFSPKKKIKIVSSEKISQKQVVAVIKTEEDINPQIDAKCPKCKNKKAYFWAKQMRGSDEAETKFYKCTKCKHIWRGKRR